MAEYQYSFTRLFRFLRRLGIKVGDASREAAERKREEARRYMAKRAEEQLREQERQSKYRARQERMADLDHECMRSDEAGYIAAVEERYSRYMLLSLFFYALGFVSCSVGCLDDPEISSFEPMIGSLICYLIGATITISGHLAHINFRLGEMLIQQYRQTSHARRQSMKRDYTE